MNVMLHSWQTLQPYHTFKPRSCAFSQTACDQWKLQPRIFFSPNVSRKARERPLSKSSTKVLTAGDIGKCVKTALNTCWHIAQYLVRRDGDLGGTEGGDRPPQKGRWRGFTMFNYDCWRNASFTQAIDQMWIAHLQNMDSSKIWTAVLNNCKKYTREDTIKTLQAN